MSRFPWGTGPAPAHNCHGCQRRMGKAAFHGIFSPDRNSVRGDLLLCMRCIDPWGGSSVGQHAQRFPECPNKWHDMWDHLDCSANRAAAWYVLAGLRSR